MQVFVVFEIAAFPDRGSVAVFSNDRKAATYSGTLEREGRAAELIELEINEKVQKPDE